MKETIIKVSLSQRNYGNVSCNKYLAQIKPKSLNPMIFESTGDDAKEALFQLCVYKTWVYLNNFLKSMNLFDFLYETGVTLAKCFMRE